MNESDQKVVNFQDACWIDASELLSSATCTLTESIPPSENIPNYRTRKNTIKFPTKEESRRVRPTQLRSKPSSRSFVLRGSIRRICKSTISRLPSIPYPYPQPAYTPDFEIMIPPKRRTRISSIFNKEPDPFAIVSSPTDSEFDATQLYKDAAGSPVHRAADRFARRYQSNNALRRKKSQTTTMFFYGTERSYSATDVNDFPPFLMRATI